MSFVLIKEYPESPGLGYVAHESVNNNGFFYVENCFVTTHYLRKYPEFWRETTDKLIDEDVLKSVPCITLNDIYDIMRPAAPFNKTRQIKFRLLVRNKLKL